MRNGSWYYKDYGAPNIVIKCGVCLKMRKKRSLVGMIFMVTDRFFYSSLIMGGGNEFEQDNHELCINVYS